MFTACVSFPVIHPLPPGVVCDHTDVGADDACERCKQIDASDALVSAWYNNGQIVSHDEITTFVEGAMTLHVTIPQADALESVHDSFYGQTARAKAPTPTVEVLGKGRNSFKTCVCKSREALYLWASVKTCSQPVLCWTCKQAVPLYQIPHPGDDRDHSHVLGWASTFNALDTLYMGSGVGEVFARKQLQTWRPDTGDLKGLSERSRFVAKSLEEAAGIPVYWPILRLSDNLRTAPPTWPCPSCGERWDLPNFGENWIRFRCEPCRLIA